MAEPVRLDVAIADLAAAMGWPTPEQFAWYEAGRVEGIAAGRRQVEDELAAEWAALSAEVMPRLRSLLPFVDLCEARGQHDRAERQRQILRDRGIV